MFDLDLDPRVVHAERVGPGHDIYPAIRAGRGDPQHVISHRIEQGGDHVLEVGGVHCLNVRANVGECRLGGLLERGRDGRVLDLGLVDVRRGIGPGLILLPLAILGHARSKPRLEVESRLAEGGQALVGRDPHSLGLDQPSGLDEWNGAEPDDFLVAPHTGPVRILGGLKGRGRDKLAHLPQDILGSKPVGVLLQHLEHTGQQLPLAPPGDLSHRTSNSHIETRCNTARAGVVSQAARDCICRTVRFSSSDNAVGTRP